MHRTVYVLFMLFLLRIGGVPSGLKISSIRDAAEEEYPFIVSLERLVIFENFERIHVLHLCTGAALTPSWTLTAGHCVNSVAPTKNITGNVRIKFVIQYGSLNGTADVISTNLQHSFKDPSLKKQNDIGLLRTQFIHLKRYASVSPIDINDLGGQKATLIGYKSISSSLRKTTETLIQKKSLQMLNVVVMRYDSRDKFTLPEECVVRRCIPTACPEDSGGPMLHSSGIIGINSVSLENVKLCSENNTNQLIGMGVITPTSPHVKWITDNIKRDAL